VAMPEGNIDVLKKKLNQSIRFKFMIVMSLILFAGTVLISFIIATNENRVLMDSLMSTGQSLASYMAKISSDPLIMKEGIQLDEIVMGAARGDNIAYAIIYDEQGAPTTSLYASINYNMPNINSILLKFSMAYELQEIIDLIKKQESVIEISHPILIGPAMINTHTIGRVAVGMDSHKIYHEFFKTIVFLVALNMLLATILVMVLFFISNKMIFTPLHEIAKASYRLSKGDLSTEVKINTTGEIKMLVDSFNTMVRNLEKVTVSKDYVDNIINSMINALLVASSDDIIVKANAATCKLLVSYVFNSCFLWHKICRLLQAQVSSKIGNNHHLFQLESQSDHLQTQFGEVIFVSVANFFDQTMNMQSFELTGNLRAVFA
jgi:HAMP domain-containing protein